MNEQFLYRRTIYLPSVRKNQLPQLDMLNLFDFADPDQTIGARSVTTVPTQSLYLMNSSFLREQSLADGPHPLWRTGESGRQKAYLLIFSCKP